MDVGLLIATGNTGKLNEIKSLLLDLKIKLWSPREKQLQIEVIESGSTYVENAALKARAYCAAAHIPSLADDTGLEVELLEGAPGLFSARYVPESGATDKDRRMFLIKQLAGFPRPWKARFRCIIALAFPGGRIHFGEGICEGTIIPEERGEGGFGYDPIFFLPKLKRTMAELSLDEKNQVSHRALAIKSIKPILRDWIERKI